MLSFNTLSILHKNRVSVCPPALHVKNQYQLQLEALLTEVSIVNV